MAISNTLVQNKNRTFTAYLTNSAVKDKINSIMSGANGEKFMTSLVTLVSNNPLIAECEHKTILAAALLGESLKLSSSPQLGQFYIVPFNDNKHGRKVAQFQLGYKGYIQLAIRSGYYRKLNVLAIKEGELISYDPLEEAIKVDLIMGDEQREKTPTIGYYAMFEYQNGFRKTMYWSKEKMEAHAKKYSQAYRTDLAKGWTYSFWTKDFDGMAYKTMLRQLISKWGIMSVEFQTAVDNDMAVLNEIGGKPEYVDNALDAEYEKVETQQIEVINPEQQENKNPLRDFN